MSTPRVGWLSGRRRRRIGAGLALVVVVVVIIVVVTAGSSSPNSAAANASTATGAATVQRRDLVETDTESGTLSYDAPQTVYNRLSGTITWLPNVGQVIHAGGTLFKVDGEPVILMNGTTPAYRDLSAADSSGEDILQLNRNLVDLGFNPDGIVINDTWQAATTDGVELFQGSLGDPETGILTLGQIVFLPGDQLISTVDGTVGSTGGGGSSGANASTTVDPPAPQFVSLRVSGSTTTPTTSTTSTTSTTPTTSTTTQPATTTPTTSTPTTTTPTTTSGHKKKKQHPSQSQTIAALIQLLRAENAQLQAELRAHHSGGGNGSGSGHSGSGHSGSGHSGSGDSGSGNSGSSGGSGGTPVEILQTTSTRLVVTVDLSASSQSEAVVGEHVTVQLPNGNTVNGRITAVSPVAQNSSSGSGNGNGNGGGGGGSGGGSGNGGSSSSTIPVTIAINGHHLGAGLDQAAVSVNFVQQRANHVLSVPVTALLATSGSTYAVQNASPPYKLIPVTTGLFAAGYVQISGAGIYSGLQVTDSQG